MRHIVKTRYIAVFFAAILLLLCFDYETYTIQCGQHVELTDLNKLVTLLPEMMTFRCHAVEHILFGALSLNDQDPYTVLQNPDVSSLTFPFVHLKRLCIETTTYDFYQLERFITYAVNYIGQDYLNKHVDVHLYGNPEKLHPNLRNSIHNLCHSVYLHDAQDTL